MRLADRLMARDTFANAERFPMAHSARRPPKGGRYKGNVTLAIAASCPRLCYSAY